MLLAIKNLTRRSVRTALSVLGVAVGVGSIVAFTAMGEGFKASIDRYGRDSGADLVLVEDRAGIPRSGASWAPRSTACAHSQACARSTLRW